MFHQTFCKTGSLRCLFSPILAGKEDKGECSWHNGLFMKVFCFW
jgi:hypothetical protein